MLKKIFVLLLITVLFITGPLNAQAVYQQEIRSSAIAFVNSLNTLQKRSALMAFDDTARVMWNNLPVGLRARAGISIGNMNEDQRKLFHRLLSVSLSSQGYLKATSIMHLDNLLNWYYDTLYYKKEIDSSLYKILAGLKWSHKNFYLAFFGSPSDPNWGFKVEGHHLSLNFTFVKDMLSVTPLFVGTDPAEYPIADYAGWRVLGQEEDLGIKLINMLSASQRKKATKSGQVPGDIITAAESGKRLIDYWGISAAELRKDQKVLLQYIIREFVFNLEYDKAMVEYDKILKADIDKIYFGWIGSYEERKPYYYVLNGPTFLIELDNSGFNNEGNHIHAIWREKGNEYAEDVLKKHYQAEKH